MQRSEPELLADRKTSLFAEAVELAARVGAALPETAHGAAGPGVFGGEEQKSSAGTEHAGNLLEGNQRRRHVLQDPAARHAVERSVLKRERADVAGDVFGTVTDVAAGSPQHTAGEIEPDDPAIPVGHMHKVLQNLSGARSDVENGVRVRDAEIAPVKQTPEQRLMQRQ